MPMFKKVVEKQVPQPWGTQTIAELVDVEYPTNRFRITKDRYINGVYIKASPTAPAIIEVPEGSKVDTGMVHESASWTRPLTHFAQPAPSHPMSSPGAIDNAVAQSAQPEPVAEPPQGGKGKSNRAADREIA